MAADHKVCIIMLGESGVGKTSLMLRFYKNIFKDENKVTLIINNYNKTIFLNDVKIELELYDTGGQERFKAIVKRYFRQADGVLLAYDITNLPSFMKLSSWLSELRELNEEASVLIVGNKADLQNQNQVSRSTVEKYARDEGLDFCETSAKNNENVDEVFKTLALKVLERKKIAPFCNEISNVETKASTLINTVSDSGGQIKKIRSSNKVSDSDEQFKERRSSNTVSDSGEQFKEKRSSNTVYDSGQQFKERSSSNTVSDSGEQFKEKSSINTISNSREQFKDISSRNMVSDSGEHFKERRSSNRASDNGEQFKERISRNTVSDSDEQFKEKSSINDVSDSGQLFKERSSRNTVSESRHQTEMSLPPVIRLEDDSQVIKLTIEKPKEKKKKSCC